jgi:hypothetical protein
LILGLGAQESGIFTNAQEGVFNTERWFWFSAASGEQLRLVLDKAEVYRGTEPAMVHLSVPAGGERGFELVAERYRPLEDSPLESRAFHIGLDRKAAASLPAPGLSINDSGLAVFTREGPDGSVIYVAPPAPETPVPDGSRERPFAFLDDALDFARRTGGGLIRLAGPVQLRKSTEITGSIGITGSYDDGFGKSGAFIEVPEGVSIRVTGGILKLQGLTLERTGGGGAIITVGAGAGFEAADSVVFSGTGPLLRVEAGGIGLFSDTLILSAAKGNTGGRGPVMGAEGGQLYMFRNRLELEGGHGILLEMRGGVLSVEEGVFRIAADTTGTAFDLTGVRADFFNPAVSVSAGDYGSALETADSKVVIIGGTLSVSARDGVIVASEGTEGFYAGTRFFMDASFVAKAMAIRGRFPSVIDCYFSFTGSARHSEVFSAFDGDGRPVQPPAGAVSGNVIRGFSHILGGEYPVDSIGGFNRLFAPPQRPNSLDMRP